MDELAGQADVVVLELGVQAAVGFEEFLVALKQVLWDYVLEGQDVTALL